jgi:hypothetical protein
MTVIRFHFLNVKLHHLTEPFLRRFEIGVQIPCQSQNQTEQQSIQIYDGI